MKTICRISSIDLHLFFDFEHLLLTSLPGQDDLSLVEEAEPEGMETAPFTSLQLPPDESKDYPGKRGLHSHQPESGGVDSGRKRKILPLPDNELGSDNNSGTRPLHPLTTDEGANDCSAKGLFYPLRDHKEANDYFGTRRIHPVVNSEGASHCSWKREPHHPSRRVVNEDDYSGNRLLHSLTANEGNYDFARKHSVSANEEGGLDYTGKRLHPILSLADVDYSGARWLHSPSTNEENLDYSYTRMFHPLPPAGEDVKEYCKNGLFLAPPVDDGGGLGDCAGKRQYHPLAGGDDGVGGEYPGKRLFQEECGGNSYYESDSGVSSLYEPLSFPGHGGSIMDSEVDELESQQGTRKLPAFSESCRLIFEVYVFF